MQTVVVTYIIKDIIFTKHNFPYNFKSYDNLLNISHVKTVYIIIYLVKLILSNNVSPYFSQNIINILDFQMKFLFYKYREQRAALEHTFYKFSNALLSNKK